MVGLDPFLANLKPIVRYLDYYAASVGRLPRQPPRGLVGHAACRHAEPAEPRHLSAPALELPEPPRASGDLAAAPAHQPRQRLPACRSRSAAAGAAARTSSSRASTATTPRRRGSRQRPGDARPTGTPLQARRHRSAGQEASIPSAPRTPANSPALRPLPSPLGARAGCLTPSPRPLPHSRSGRAASSSRT